MIIVWGVLGTIAFSCILAFIPDMIDFCKKRKKRWLTVPEDDQYRQVILTFTDFHKFYVANPNAYELKKGFMHPFRDKYFIQFPSLYEYIKYEKWLTKKAGFEANKYTQRDFIRLVQSDLDDARKEQEEWLKKQREEINKQYMELAGSYGEEETVINGHESLYEYSEADEAKDLEAAQTVFEKHRSCGEVENSDG